MPIDNERIETVARQFCKNLGIDPDEQVGTGFGGDFTPSEWSDYSSNAVPAVLIYMPRWRLYRGQAAEAIAMKDAV